MLVSGELAMSFLNKNKLRLRSEMTQYEVLPKSFFCVNHPEALPCRLQQI
jgi:hypothetical protein